MVLDVTVDGVSAKCRVRFVSTLRICEANVEQLCHSGSCDRLSGVYFTPAVRRGG